MLLISVTATGCGQSPANKVPGTDTSQTSGNDEAHDHRGLWCAEHGLPEVQCGMCSAKAADGFEANGDWCEEHQRVESLCYKCDPSRTEKSAKLYEAKCGHTSPRPTE